MKTFIEVLETHAQNIPHHKLYTFLNDKGEEVATLTYGEFQKKSKAIATWLQKKLGKKVKGSRILLLYEPGLEFICGFFGCLYAGAIAVPAYPPDLKQLNKSLPRIEGIVKDCGATLVFTNKKIKNGLKILSFRIPHLLFKSIVATDQISLTHSEQWQNPEVLTEDIAFLQYTSGSTSDPKGVMVTHQNLLHNSKLIKDFYGHDQNSRGVIWLPSYHDMGLIGGILQPLFVGFPVTLLSPISFIKNPYLWLKLISDTKATTSGGPNFAYELCLKRITADQKKNLDLSHWQVAFSGAEPVKMETIDKFSEFFAQSKFKKEAFYPCYGLAEATLIVSGVKKMQPIQFIKIKSDRLAKDQIERVVESKDALNYVSCGKSHPDQIIKIVDFEKNTVLNENEVGEVWVQGPSVAKGYWNKTEKTKEIFSAYTAEGTGPFLRTGDKGFLHQGNLYITGRIKDLIIINGKNYYPQDIELTIEKNATWIRQGAVAAFSVEASAGEELVVVAEINKSKINVHNYLELLQKLNESLWIEHQLRPKEVVLIEARTISKTSSGKLQRFLVKKNYQQKKLNEVFFQIKTPVHLMPWNFFGMIFNKKKLSNDQTLNYLLDQISSLIKKEKSQIDLTLPISQFYLDSINLISFHGEIVNKFNIPLPLNESFYKKNLNELTQLITYKKSQPALVGKTTQTKTHLRKKISTALQMNSLTIPGLKKDVIFLTGATGILGSYLLREILLQTSSQIYCLVRAKTLLEAQNRLKDALKQYGDMDKWEGAFFKRVTPIVGDISKTKFGLNENEYQYLTGQVHQVIHAASNTNLLLSYDLLRDTNIVGTGHIIEFTLKTSQKCLHYVSSYSVMGDLVKLKDFEFKESDFDLGQRFHKMPYQKTKFVAEKLVRRAKARGLNFNIYRPGNIWGDSKTGLYPFASSGVSHLYYQVIELVLKLSMTTKSDFLFDVSPIDFVAKGMVAVIFKSDRYQETYHLFNSHLQTWNELMNLLDRSGHSLNFISIDQYYHMLKRIEDIMSVSAFESFREIFTLMRYGFVDKNYLLSNAKLSTAKTDEILKALDVHLPVITKEVLNLYIEKYFSGKQKNNIVSTVDSYHFSEFLEQFKKQEVKKS